MITSLDDAEYPSRSTRDCGPTFTPQTLLATCLPEPHICGLGLCRRMHEIVAVKCVWLNTHWSAVPTRDEIEVDEEIVRVEIQIEKHAAISITGLDIALNSQQCPLWQQLGHVRTCLRAKAFDRLRRVLGLWRIDTDEPHTLCVSIKIDLDSVAIDNFYNFGACNFDYIGLTDLWW